MPALSLVIPCYNEAANLPLLVGRCAEVFAGTECEVILVDNGSSDNTPQVMAELIAPHPFIKMVRVDVNRGYGFGILEGLRSATGTVIGWTHADMQTDPADALKGLEFFNTHPHPEQLFVKGKRYGRPWADEVFSVGMAIFEFFLLFTPLWDINAQPTLFPRTFFDQWQDPPEDFSLDLYAYYLARKKGLDVARFPVLFGERAHGSSHWNLNWQAKVKFIKRTLVFSFQLRRRLKGV